MVKWMLLFVVHLPKLPISDNMAIIFVVSVVFAIFFRLEYNGASATNIPAGLKFCSKSDPELGKCITEQMTNALKLFKDGNPELGIPKIEPFLIPSLEIAGASGRAVQLDQKYDNLMTHGISESEAYDPHFELFNGKCVWDFMVLSPHIYMSADYTIKGQLLVFPLNAHGKGKITATNLRNHHKALCERYQKNGKTYVRLTNYTMNMEAEKMTFEFPNIIPGNEQFSKQIQQTVNENADEIFKEVKFGFEELWSQLHIKTVNNFLAKFSVDEIFPN